MKKENLQFLDDNSIEIRLEDVKLLNLAEFNFTEKLSIYAKDKSIFVKFNSIEKLNLFKANILSSFNVNKKFWYESNENKLLKVKLFDSTESVEKKLITSYNKRVLEALLILFGVEVELMKCPEELGIVREKITELEKINQAQFLTIDQQSVEIKSQSQVIDQQSIELRSQSQVIGQQSVELRSQSQVIDQQSVELLSQSDRIAKLEKAIAKFIE